MASTYTLISSQVLASSAASVTFSSIPATYTDLVLRMSARSSTSATVDGIDWYINTTSINASSYTTLQGNGASVTSVRSGGFSNAAQNSIDAATSTANTFGSVEIYLPNYAGTTTKPSSSFAAAENNTTTAYIVAQAYFYNNTTAVSSLIFYPSTYTNFVTGSSFYLYGIKNS